MQTINDRIGIVLKNSQKTKTEFAKSLKVSQQYISKLVKMGNPSDMLIEDICQKYNVREEWLRTGEEPMQKTITPDDRYSHNLAKLVNTDDKTIINWVNAIAETNPAILREIEEFLKKLLGMNE